MSTFIINPNLGVNEYLLGITMQEFIRDIKAEYAAFKRNAIQINQSIRIPDEGIIVYFDNDNVSAAIEILKGEANLHGAAILNRPLSEAKRSLEHKFTFSKIDDDTYCIPDLGVNLFTQKKGRIAIVDSILVYGRNYLDNYDIVS